MKRDPSRLSHVHVLLVGTELSLSPRRGALPLWVEFEMRFTAIIANEVRFKVEDHSSKPKRAGYLSGLGLAMMTRLAARQERAITSSFLEDLT